MASATAPSDIINTQAGPSQAGPSKAGEPAWHRAHRKQRSSDRVVVALARACSRLRAHHSSPDQMGGWYGRSRPWVACTQNAGQSLGCMWTLALILAGAVAVVFPRGGRDLRRRTRTKEPRVQCMLRKLRGSWTLTNVKATRMSSSASRRKFAPTCSEAGCGHHSGFAKSLQGCSGEKRGQVPA